MSRCDLCGGPITEPVCLDCVTALDDEMHAALLSQVGTQLSETPAQYAYCERVFHAYRAAVAHARGRRATP
jgi:hypothetical protein